MKTTVKFRNVWTGPEPYGCAGHCGNKYWVNVPFGTPKEDVVLMLQEELPARKKERVTFPGYGSVKVTEITFFVYNSPDPDTGMTKIPGEVAADLIYEWTEEDGLKEAE